MKRKLVSIAIGLSAATLLTGCILAPSFSIGGGKKDATSNTSSTSNTSNTAATSNTSNTAATSNDPHSNVARQTVEPTIGQQLLDLKKARDAGAISEQEYETEKAKILNAKQ